MSDDATNSVNWEAALARTATRGLALYFSRPVRLFRPSKVSGWHSLRNVAGETGLSRQFLTGLVKSEGFMVIPKHFVPPMIVNAALGTVLWTAYQEVNDCVLPMMPTHLTTAAAISGAAAGAAQSIIAAPAENVRLVLEGGAVSGSWSHAWKEVFRGTTTASATDSRQHRREDVRQIRAWMHEVRDMAGNGWKGWAWGAGKDIFGFATFFSIFELTRRVALNLRSWTESYIDERLINKSTQKHVSRTVHAVALITGGVTAGIAYELQCRPWDNARRAILLARLTAQHPAKPTSSSVILARRVKEDGLLSFFTDPAAPSDRPSGSSMRGAGALRTLARVGPWGIGFLVFEIFGPGLH